MDKSAEEMEAEVVEVIGYFYTHIDCECGYVMYCEGDVRGEEITCEDCGTKMYVTEVR